MTSLSKLGHNRCGVKRLRASPYEGAVAVFESNIESQHNSPKPKAVHIGNGFYGEEDFSCNICCCLFAFFVLGIIVVKFACWTEGG
jgi:uncharacterized membrane protein YqaE (UPF0057 family)